MNAFIDEHRARCGIEPICTTLQIAPSAYRLHAARRRDPALRPARAKRDARLLPEVQRVFDQNLQVYGADKVWRQLLREGLVVARCTVERLMRLAGLRGVRRGKSVRTTVPDAARVKVVVASFMQPAAAYLLPSSAPRRPSLVLD